MCDDTSVHILSHPNTELLERLKNVIRATMPGCSEEIETYHAKHESFEFHILPKLRQSILWDRRLNVIVQKILSLALKRVVFATNKAPVNHCATIIKKRNNHIVIDENTVPMSGSIPEKLSATESELLVKRILVGRVLMRGKRSDFKTGTGVCKVYIASIYEDFCCGGKQCYDTTLPVHHPHKPAHYIQMRLQDGPLATPEVVIPIVNILQVEILERPKPSYNTMSSVHRKEVNSIYPEGVSDNVSWSSGEDEKDDYDAICKDVDDMKRRNTDPIEIVLCIRTITRKFEIIMPHKTAANMWNCEIHRLRCDTGVLVSNEFSKETTDRPYEKTNESLNRHPEEENDGKHILSPQIRKRQQSSGHRIENVLSCRKKTLRLTYLDVANERSEKSTTLADTVLKSTQKKTHPQEKCYPESKTFTFPTENEYITIGRMENSDIFLPNLSVSRMHARIQRIAYRTEKDHLGAMEEFFIITDLGSKRGIFYTYILPERKDMNGKTELAEISDGDSFLISNFRFQVSIENDTVLHPYSNISPSQPPPQHIVFNTDSV